MVQSSINNQNLVDAKKTKDGMDLDAKKNFSVKMEWYGMCFSLNVNAQVIHFGMVLIAWLKQLALTEESEINWTTVSALQELIGMEIGVRL